MPNSPKSEMAQTPLPFVHDNLRAISWLALSIVATSIMTIAVRMVSVEIHPSMIVLLRFGFTAIGMVVMLSLWTSWRQRLRFTDKKTHFLRSFFMAVSTHLGFYAIAHIELVTVTILFFMVPIFATILASFMNGEQAGMRRISAIAISFLGVILILKPGYQSFNPAMIAALLSSVLFALALVLSRRLAHVDGTFSVFTASIFMTVLVSIPLAIPVWSLPQSSVIWVIVAVMVVTGMIRILGDIQAYRFGEASILAPITYTRLILIGIAAYFLFDEIPDAFAISGAVLIIGAALYIARRESRLKRRNSTAETQSPTSD